MPPHASIPIDQEPYMSKVDRVEEKRENKYQARPSQTVHLYNPNVGPLSYSPEVGNFPENPKTHEGFGKSEVKRTIQWEKEIESKDHTI